MKKKDIVFSIELVRRMWEDLESESILEIGECMRCSTRGKCLNIGCDHRLCKQVHYLCEFCFIDGASKGIITPDITMDEHAEEDTKSILEDVLFGGKENE